MFVNKYSVNIGKSYTANTITIGLTTNYDFNGLNEIINEKFVKKGIEESVNPIIDYERVKFKPIDFNTELRLNMIEYKPFLVNNGEIKIPTHYSDMGFEYNDVFYRKNNFKYSHLLLRFYDNTNQLTQNLIHTVKLYLNMDESSDLLMNGNPKPTNEIPIIFKLTSKNNRLNKANDGFYLFDYKSDYLESPYKELYCRAVLNNAKNGRSIELVTKNRPLRVEEVNEHRYMKYIFKKSEDGYFYAIDDIYSDNIQSNGRVGTINLYEIREI